MDHKTIAAMASASDKLSRSSVKNEGESDPIKALMIPGLSVHTPPGALADFCSIIDKHFERREGSESYRIIGALGAAQLIAGRNVVTPTDSKIMFQMMLVAPSGSGKTACLQFIGKAAFALGLDDRYRSSTVTSLKQLQMAAIEAGGSLIYAVDDNDTHVLNWDNERSPLEGISNLIRSESSSTIPWTASSPIRTAFDEVLASASADKLIEGKSKSEGWLVPRVDGGRAIDFVAFAKMNQDVAKRYAKAKKDADMAQKPIERFKIVPIISLTPDKGKKIIANWKDNGSMGRTFFISNSGDIKEKKQDPTDWKTMPFANQWKPRIPHGMVKGKWGEGAREKYIELDRKIDSLRNDGGITGTVSARYGQLIIDLATLCAFVDPVARSGNDFYVNVNHIEWAYQACLESLIAMRDYSEGEPEENGLEADEWKAIIRKIKNCVEGNSKFIASQSVSVMRNKVCRDRVNTIISACSSSGMHMNAEIFLHRVLECIGSCRYAPVDLDPENMRKVRIIEGGKWDDIPMTAEVRNILATAMTRIKWMRK